MHGFPDGSVDKEPASMPEMWVWSLGWEDPLEQKMATTPVFLLEKSHRQRSLEGYSPKGCQELDMTEWLHSRTYCLMPKTVLLITPHRELPWSLELHEESPSYHLYYINNSLLFCFPFCNSLPRVLIMTGTGEQSKRQWESLQFGSTLPCCYEIFEPAYLWPNLSIHN